MDRQLLKACFHNALYIDERPEGLAPCRYTPSQCAFYDALPYGIIMGGKARCASGVTLEFDTDAPEATLLWQITDGYLPHTAERTTTIDVYINGVLRLQEAVTCEFHQPQRSVFALGSGKKNVVIWLPHTHDFVLKDILLPEGFSLTPVPQRKRKVLMLGDSITQGIGSDFSSTGYAMQLGRALNAEALNQSVAAVRFEPDCLEPLKDFAPDLITVALGTNDWSHRTDKADYDKYAVPFFAKLNSLFPGVPVLVITPVKRCRQEPDLPPDKPDTYRESGLCSAIAAMCAPYPQMRCVDGWTLMPHVAGFFRDGLHPNDLGMTWYFNALLPYAQEMLK